MKAAVSTKLIKEALDFVVAEKSDALPILNRTVAIFASGKTLSVRSTDLEMTMTATIPAVVSEEGGFVVSKAMLKNYLSDSGETVLHCWPAGEVRVVDKKKNKAESGGKLHISCDDLQGWIEDLDYTQYPSMIDCKWKKFLTFDETAVDYIATGVVPFAARSTLRPVLAGMMMNEKVVCCTDSYRLCEYVHTKKAKVGDQYIVSVKPFPHIHKHARTVDVYIDKEGNFAEYRLQNLRGSVEDIEKVITARLIDGKFPDYTQVMMKKKDITASVVFDREALMKAVKKLHPIAKDMNNNVRFVTAKGSDKITLSSKHMKAEMSVNVPLAESAPADVLASLSSVYVTDALMTLHGKHVVMEYRDQMHAVQFRVRDEADRTCLVMPLRLQED